VLAPLHETGDTQLCVLDFAKKEIYLGNAEYKTGKQAYLRPMIHVDLKPFFDQKW